MLSTKEIKNTKQASHYFVQQDNYYTREEGIQKSEWYGKGATTLQLTGEIDTEQFKALLEGRLPMGQQLGKRIDGELKHRAGWDLTFSAPKSVSLLALMGGDKRLLEAHRQAVKVALSDIERGCSQVRQKTANGMIFQNTQNLVTSLFHHDLSRAHDPQLHTHCVVFNMTQRTDGQWRSQASQLGHYGEQVSTDVNGFIERVRHHKRYYGQLYRNELAYHVKQLGYELVVDRKTGFFEIAGVSREAIDHFSQRRQDIVEQLEEQDLVGGKAAAIATLNTRESKKTIERDVLLQQWEQRAQALGFNYKKIIDQCAKTISAENTFSSQQTKIDQLAQRALQEAIQELSRFQTTFTLEAVITGATRNAIQQTIRTENLLTALKSLVSSGELIELPQDNQKTMYMAKTTLEAEQRLLSFIKEATNHHSFIDNSCFDNFFAQHTELNRMQQQQLTTVFNEQPLVIVEGNQTKESIIEPMIRLAKASRLSVAVLSPHAVGSRRLAHTLEPKPQTLWDHIKAFFLDDSLKSYSVHQFLSRFSEHNTTTRTPTLLLVDNAHLIPTQIMADLAAWTSKHASKLILFGEQEKLLPQQTGMPFHQLIAQGASTIRSPAYSTFPGNVTPFKTQVEKIANCMVEIPQKEDRLQAMADHFARLPNQVRYQSWLVATNKQTVDELNLLTHQALQHQIPLRKSVKIPVFIPVFLSQEKLLHALSYPPNHWLRFNQPIHTLWIKRGDYLRITRIDKESNTVLLENKKGKLIAWRPDKMTSFQGDCVELFEQRKREFNVGEQVILHRSLLDKKLLKGERLMITDCRETRLILQNEKQQSFQLDIRKPYHCHLDYGYASTLHKIAHEKPHTLIAELPSKSLHTHKRQWNQLCTQPQHSWFYTDDISELAASLERNTGDRLTAQEILKTSSVLKRQVHTLYDILENHITAAGVQRPLSHSAVEAIDYALQHVAEREAGFTHKHLMEVALSHALGEVSQTDLLQVLKTAEKAGIFLKGHREDGTLWTTLKAITLEREIIKLCQQGRGILQPLASEATLQKFCDPNHLNSEQIVAVKAITQSPDRIVAVQGYAGTGKTTMLQTVQSVLNEHQYQMKGLAPTHTAVKELQQRGIPAQTLDSFINATQQLLHENPSEHHSTEMLVLDEASLVSNHKMLTLLHLVHQMKYRLVIVGDTRQLPAIEAGKPQSLMQTQLETISLTNIQRQHDPALKQAVKETIHYDFKSVFKTLAASIVEINEKTQTKTRGHEKSADTIRLERLNQLVQDYFAYPKNIRDTILIVTPGHDDRLLTNTLIRDQLKQEGLLTGIPESFPILISHSLTQVERSHIYSYSIGDRVRFGKSYQGVIKAGEYATVIGLHPDHRLITLKTADGREVTWQIPYYQEERLSAVEVFKAESRELQVGDYIRWTRTDKANHRLSAELASVTAVERHQVTVELANKTSFTFNPHESSYQHWEHGYASTVYAAQGTTKSIVLAHLESFRTNLTSQPAFLVALTRAVDTFRVYTDDKAALLRQIHKNAGLKRSSLEVIGEYPSYSKVVKKTHDAKPITPRKKLNENNKVISAKKTPMILHAHRSHWDPHALRQFREVLNRDAERIAIALLGKPVARNGNTLRFGSHQGSLIVTVKGAKQGLWYDFALPKTLKGKSGGDMLMLIQVQKGLGLKASLRYAANYLPLLLNDKFNEPIKYSDRSLQKVPHQSHIREWSSEQKNKIALAKRFAHQSLPVKKTLAERYLKEHRGICLDQYSKDIRFHPGIYSKINGKTLPALLVLARDNHHRLQAVQAIYLDETTGQKIDKAVASIQKQTFGVLQGALVTLSSSNQGITIVAEGPETGLSLMQALPHTTVKVTLGKSNLLHLDACPLDSKVIFCLDNDNKSVKDDPIIEGSVRKLVEQGKAVRLMMPRCLGETKQDYNNVLRQKGITAIRHDFDNAIAYERLFDRQWSKTTSHSSFQYPHEHQASISQPSTSSDKCVKVVSQRQKETEVER